MMHLLLLCLFLFSYQIGIAQVDTDGDGISNLLDIDDDNDGLLDVDEGCAGQIYDMNSLSWTGDTAMSITALSSNSLEGSSTSG